MVQSFRGYQAGSSARLALCFAALLAAAVAHAGQAPEPPAIDPDSGMVTVGEQTWHFTFADGPGARCRTGSLGNRNGIVAIGYQVGADGMPVDDPATLTVNVYPEDWQPRGKQAHEIAIRGGGPGNEWSTAGVSVVEANPQVADLARARVTDWRLQGSRTWGSVTLYLRDTLVDAQAGGALTLADGQFHVRCE